jgi:hypothetical protein
MPQGETFAPSDDSGFWLCVNAADAPRSSRLPKLRRQRSVAYVSDEGMGIVFSASRDPPIKQFWKSGWPNQPNTYEPLTVEHL